MDEQQAQRAARQAARDVRQAQITARLQADIRASTDFIFGGGAAPNQVRMSERSSTSLYHSNGSLVVPMQCCLFSRMLSDSCAFLLLLYFSLMECFSVAQQGAFAAARAQRAEEQVRRAALAAAGICVRLWTRGLSLFEEQRTGVEAARLHSIAFALLLGNLQIHPILLSCACSYIMQHIHTHVRPSAPTLCRHAWC